MRNLFVVILGVVAIQSAHAMSCNQLCSQAKADIRAHKSEVAAIAMQSIASRYGISSPYQTVEYTAQGGYYLASAISGAQNGPMKLADVCPSLRLGALSDTPFNIAALAFATKSLRDQQAPWTCN